MITRNLYSSTNLSFRPYEMSVWTLNDDFIAVFKSEDMDVKGSINDPEIVLADDGTQELHFSIPISLYYEEEESNLVNNTFPVYSRVVKKKQNPLWENGISGRLLQSARKIKVILNKRQDNEAVFEFVINEMTESHSKDGLICSIRAVGLPFFELGRTGYKVVLSADEFYVSYENWFDSRPVRESGELVADYNIRVAEWEAAEPIANIQYWNNLLGLTEYAATETHFSNSWYYVIDMDWSTYGHSDERAANKVYEEPYATSWKINLTPEKMEKHKEKARMVEGSNSNLYNLSQTIAKTFGVFCRYEYEYDANYHIIARKIIYQNTFSRNEENILQITYPYQASSISRTIDSNDLISKLYVTSVDDGSSNMISITDTPVNPTCEDYILDFDYLYSIGAMNTEQHDLIAPYQEKMREYNQDLITYRTQLDGYYTELNDVKAKITFYSNAVLNDQERISDLNAQISSLDMIDGRANGVINNTAPKTQILVKDNEEIYHLNITEKGVIFNTVKIYRSYDFSTYTLSDQVERGNAVVDEYGNLIRIEGIHISGTLNRNTVYLTYSYDPAGYYKRILTVWNERLAKDSTEKNNYTSQQTLLENNIEIVEDLYNNVLAEKESAIKKFNREMGSLLREGYWTPDTYRDCQNRFKEELILPQIPTGRAQGTTPYLKKLFWDKELFDDEISHRYTLGLAEDRYSHICIDLSLALAHYKDCLDQLTVSFYDFEESIDRQYVIQNARFFTAGSTCEYAVLSYRDNGTTKLIPVLVLTGDTALTDTEKDLLRATAQLGVLVADDNGLTLTQNEAALCLSNNILNNTSTAIYYPRFQITNTYLKTGTADLLVSYNEIPLKKFEDYYVLTRNGETYVTIKPEAMFRQSDLFATFKIIYTISNVNTSIYLDATEVAKENSRPKVSYEVSLNYLNPDFIHNSFNLLTQVVQITDPELHFQNIQGYISRLTLKLDNPEGDAIEIKNYKNKFEDLFSSIVAATEAMQQTQYTSGLALGAFNNDGTLKEELLQTSLSNMDIDYSFNTGKLSITSEAGIQSITDTGIVCMRGDGIFTTNSKDENNEWIWKGAVTPEGVKAEAITRGTLNIRDMVIQSGDDVRFQLNKDGLYAFKSFKEDADLVQKLYDIGQQSILEQAENPGIDKLQYVVHNSQGLFLVARAGDIVLDVDKQTGQPYARTLTVPINRVEISWNGFIIRNWDNQKVFYADTDGNLMLEGKIKTKAGGQLASWHIGDNTLYSGTGVGYVALSSSENGYQDSEGTHWVFWAGDPDPLKAKFRLSNDGTLYTKGGTQEGVNIIAASDSTFTGTIYTSNGILGGPNSNIGLSIFTGGIGDGRTGYIKTSSGSDIAFWAGSDNYTENDQDMLKNDTNIKFKIFGNGTSYISNSTLTNSTINGNTNIQIGSFTVATTGKCTMGDVEITGGTMAFGTAPFGEINLNFMPSGWEPYTSIKDNHLIAIGAYLDWVHISGLLNLQLGSERVNVLEVDSQNRCRIKSIALAEGDYLTSIAQILQGTNTLELSHIEYGTYLQRLSENVEFCLETGHQGISWASLATATSGNVESATSTTGGDTNVYTGTGFTISPLGLTFTQSSALTVNIGSTSGSSPHFLSINTENNQLSLEYRGKATIYNGKLGPFSITSAGLSQSSGSSSTFYGTSSISMTNGEGHTFFSVNDSGITTDNLTLQPTEGEESIITMYYYDSDNQPQSITLSAQELMRLKRLIT